MGTSENKRKTKKKRKKRDCAQNERKHIFLTTLLILGIMLKTRREDYNEEVSLFFAFVCFF